MFSQYPMPFQQPYQQPFGQMQRNDMQEIDGPESIPLLRMMPNSKQIFKDKHLMRIYAVEADAAGVLSFNAFDLIPVEKEKPKEYLTREEFEQWRSRYEWMEPVPKQPENQPRAAREYPQEYQRREAATASQPVYEQAYSPAVI